MKIKILFGFIILTSIIFIQSSFAFSKLPGDSTGFQSKPPVGNVEIEYPYIRHLGNFGKVWSNSQGIQLGYGLNYNNMYMLTFKSGYLKANTRSGVVSDSTLRVVPLMVGGKYMFNYGNFKPYFSLTSGFNIIFGEYNKYSDSTMTTKVKSNETFFKLYFQIGTGAYVKLYKNFNLNLGIKYNAHFYREEAMMTGFEYSIGVSYILNKLLF